LAWLLLAWVAGACGAADDTTPPSLAAPGFVDGQSVDDDALTIAVVATDDGGVTGVTYLTDHGAAGTCPATGGNGHACGPIPLVVGANAVLVRAFDGAGNAASLVLSVERTPPADETPPTLTVFGLDDRMEVTTEAVTTTAVASDPSGVAAVTYATDHGASGACGPPAGDAYPCGPIPLPLGETRITITATDMPGNATSIVRRVRRVAPDVTPPTLSVTGVEDGATVTTASIQLTAFAVDDRGIASVRYATDQGAAGTCGPPSGDAYPCGPIPLPLGDTRVTVTARDAAGNAATDARTVRREENEPPPPPPPPPPSDFEIELVFFDHMYTPSQVATFVAAAARWSEVVTGDLEGLAVDLAANASCGRGEPAYAGTIDDVTVFVTSFAEGPGGLLGYAGPCLLRASGGDAGLPALGFMALDTLDLAALEANGSLSATIVHELGHVLGFGTLWEAAPFFDLLDYVPEGVATSCRAASGFVVPPTFNGGEAVAGWRGLGGAGDVPVEDEGGAGTRCGHWDEGTFGNELMTGWLDVGASNPLSGVTVGSLADLGYAVDATAADPYGLPAPGALARVERIDLAGREALARPVGAIDPATGDVTPLPPHDR
jgi:hypothetical protein